jgi:hypothetical protein
MHYGPRVAARPPSPSTTPALCHDGLRRDVTSLKPNPPRFPATVPPDVLLQVADALQMWDGTLPAPAEAVRAAREVLARIGIPDPAGGWDVWEGTSHAWGQRR